MNNLFSEDFKKVLLDEIPAFREFGHKFLNGEVSKMDFKKVSGGFGIYAQRDQKSFMIRLRVSCGVFSREQLHKVYEVAKKYNVDKVHLTTRQAVQLHDLSIDAVCDIMEECIHKDIFTRGGGGNFPRNVAISPLSGVDIEDKFDVVPYALACDNHFIKNSYTYKLPRKLKVSVASNDKDCSHCTVQDLGFVAVKDGIKECFRVFFGGGMGRNPKIGIELGETIEAKDILYHIDAMVLMFKTNGNYENKNKARVRYMIDTLGEDGFRSEYKKALEEVKAKGGLGLTILPIDYEKNGCEIDIDHPRLFKQKQQGLYSVYVHPIGGQFNLCDYKTLLDALDEMENIHVRSCMTEGFYILNLNGAEAKKVIELTSSFSAETKLEQSVACIGVPICQMGILRSQHLLEDIIKYFKDNNYSKDVLPSVHIAGCGNSCGVPQIGAIGFSGKMKRVNDVSSPVYETSLGGDVGVGCSKFGKVYGDIKEDDVKVFLLELAKEVESSGLCFDEFIDKQQDKLNDVIGKYLV
ncbi:nitrite/sulfite reductase [Clostridium sp.]|uniref:nitrite/sulfite reductase n=1 Tax=Clostridium sp. TaxID=1506 RepID=UPI003F2CDF98